MNATRSIITTAVLFCGGCALPEKQSDTPPGNAHLVNATLWQQTAGENRALFYQGYNAATRSLEEKLRNHKGPKPPAVILDVDETVLDNSPYQARTILKGISFPTGWTEWVKEARAEALPGAVEFLRFADKQGVALFYVTNRRKLEGEKAPTIANMRRLGIPQARPDRMFLQTTDSSKEKRRQQVLNNHEVLLLIGDQLGDFAQEFEKRPVHTRNALVDRNRRAFGDRYIVLPNPMYGDYEQAVYKYDFSGTPAQRATMRHRALRTR